MVDLPDFQLVFEAAPASYLVLDRDFRILAATDAYLAATATSREEVVGRNLLDLFPGNPDDTGGIGTRSLQASLAKVIRTGEPHTMRAQRYGIRRSGREDGAEIRHWTPVNTPVIVDGELQYIIHGLEDVTSRVHLDELRDENEQTTSQLFSLREADHEKDEFIAIISHELRTPMTSILGWTRMLALGGLDEPTRQEALDSLERSTLAQAKLIEDLLDESRIASGKLALDPRVLDLRTVVHSAISMARPAADAKEIHLEVEEEDQSCRVLGDPARLQQAVGNLIGNAIKFTRDGGKVFVRVGCEGLEGFIEVTDTGRGITPELFPHLFERFRQGEGQAVERQSGLGLGLSITRHLVELHGGSVVASSSGEGQGSTFAIRIPLHEGTSDDIKNRDAAARARTLPQVSGVHVLLVEDESDNRKVLSAALRHCGAEVTCAGTAAEALKMVGEARPDVLICDISLPDLDGCELLPRLRSAQEGTGKQTPALALTVLGRPGEQARITAAGFDLFRQKPIDPVDLAHEVARLAKGASVRLDSLAPEQRGHDKENRRS